VTLESDLRRDLQARAAVVRTAPDLDDLAGRLRRAAARAERRDRRVVGAAVTALALAVGGLAGALATRPTVSPTEVQGARGVLGQGTTASARHPRSTEAPRRPAAAAPRVLRLSAGGVTVLLTERALPGPVAVGTQWSPVVSCNTADLVTTTAGRSGAFAESTGVVGLPALAPSGLEVVDSGDLPTSTGAEVWWLTVATGSSVARVAAQGPGGQVAAARPSGGLAILAGVEATGVTGPREISAVAEDGQGRSLASLGVLIGSGPKVVGEQATASPPASGASACAGLRFPSKASSAAASQPGDLRLAAAAVVASYEEAFSVGTAAAASSAGAGLPAVTVSEVSFLSATRADVVYRVPGGLWLTGLADLGTGGHWVIDAASVCGSGSPAAGTLTCPS